MRSRLRLGHVLEGGRPEYRRRAEVAGAPESSLLDHLVSPLPGNASRSRNGIVAGSCREGGARSMNRGGRPRRAPPSAPAPPGGAAHEVAAAGGVRSLARVRGASRRAGRLARVDRPRVAHREPRAGRARPRSGRGDRGGGAGVRGPRLGLARLLRGALVGGGQAERRPRLHRVRGDRLAASLERDRAHGPRAPRSTPAGSGASRSSSWTSAATGWTASSCASTGPLGPTPGQWPLPDLARAELQHLHCLARAGGAGAVGWTSRRPRSARTSSRAYPSPLSPGGGVQAFVLRPRWRRRGAGGGDRGEPNDGSGDPDGGAQRAGRLGYRYFATGDTEYKVGTPPRTPCTVSRRASLSCSDSRCRAADDCPAAVSAEFEEQLHGVRSRHARGRREGAPPAAAVSRRRVSPCGNRRRAR